MRVGLRTRDALHAALDLVLDALEQDALEAAGQPVIKPRQARPVAPGNVLTQADVDRAVAIGRKSGILR